MRIPREIAETKCPDCGASWRETLPPFRELTCETCKSEKRRRIDAVNKAWERHEERLKFRADLMTAEEIRQAEEDVKELDGRVE